MYFDYLIVLVFALVGGLFALVSQRGFSRSPLRAPVELDLRTLATGLVFVLFTAGIALLFAWALVLRDCLHDSGPAQSLRIGANALAAGGLFLLMLFLGFVHVRKSR